MTLKDIHSIDDLLKHAKELIPGGLADGKPSSIFPKDQVEKGIQVEHEHTDDSAVAQEIVEDHLVENDEYYDYLDDMEELMKESHDIKRADALLEKYGMV